jgi:hypothetical protein
MAVLVLTAETGPDLLNRGERKDKAETLKTETLKSI